MIVGPRCASCGRPEWMEGLRREWMIVDYDDFTLEIELVCRPCMVRLWLVRDDVTERREAADALAERLEDAFR